MMNWVEVVATVVCWVWVWQGRRPRSLGLVSITVRGVRVREAFMRARGAVPTMFAGMAGPIFGLIMLMIEEIEALKAEKRGKDGE